MIELKKIGVNEIKLVGDYFIKNKSNLPQVIHDFGEVEKTNGFGTIFLTPKNPLFKTIWIHVENGEIKSIGIGGPKLGLTLKDLMAVYEKYNEGYSIYDEEYIYVFYSQHIPDYSIKILSKSKVINDENLIMDLPINSFNINLM